MLKSRKTKLFHTLLATASASALIVMVEAGPLRAENVQNWWLSLEGQYQFWDADTVSFSDQFVEFDGPFPDISLDDGFGFAGEFGWKLDDMHSIVARGRVSNPDRSHVDVSASDSAERDGSIMMADLEIGRDVGLGALGLGEGDLRAFIGVRVGHVNDEHSAYSDFNDASETSKRTFTGAGPRVGFDSSKRLGEHVSLDIGVAGGVLFGRQREETSFYSGFGPDSSSSDSKTAVVPTVDASAALSFLLNENTSMSAGYRVDAFFDVLSDGNGGKTDRVIHGPFLKLTIKN